MKRITLNEASKKYMEITKNNACKILQVNWKKSLLNYEEGDYLFQYQMDEYERCCMKMIYDYLHKA